MNKKPEILGEIKTLEITDKNQNQNQNQTILEPNLNLINQKIESRNGVVVVTEIKSIKILTKFRSNVFKSTNLSPINLNPQTKI